jgi:large subunit ribosomal protein L15
VDLSQLSAPGARHRRIRVGRGNASGKGTYAGKGLKGQKARSGNDLRIGFEGGQLPLVRRMARKRGFTNIFRVEYEWVNLRQLAELPAGSVVTRESLVAAGVIKHNSKPLKILGDGELTQPLTVRAQRFTASARQKIEAAGGSVDELAPRAPAQAEEAREPEAAGESGEG